MKLMEFQGKQIFARYGIRIPSAKLLRRGDSIDGLPVPVVLKAQVLAGGRGKAGGIKMVTEKDKLAGVLDSLFSMTIKGEPVGAVLAVEEEISIKRELYLSITRKGSKGEPVIIVSGDGGMEIENIAKTDPDKIVMMPVDTQVGVTAYQARYIARRIGCEDFKGLYKVIAALYDAFVGEDAQLVEINPLAVTEHGFMALDAKVVLDNNARYRHEELFARLEAEQGEAAERRRDDTITFVGMHGDVALISDGAGTGMLTLDMVHAQGGELASFCELGGVTNADVMYTAMKESLEWQGGAKCLLVVLIGGFNRMDHMAEGIIRYRQEHSFHLPVVVRMCGTMEDVGKEMLSQAGLVSIDDLGQAVEQAVRSAKEA